MTETTKRKYKPRDIIIEEPLMLIFCGYILIEDDEYKSIDTNSENTVFVNIAGYADKKIAVSIYHESGMSVKFFNDFDKLKKSDPLLAKFLEDKSNEANDETN